MRGSHPFSASSYQAEWHVSMPIDSHQRPCSNSMYLFRQTPQATADVNSQTTLRPLETSQLRRHFALGLALVYKPYYEMVRVESPAHFEEERCNRMITSTAQTR